MGPVTDEMVSLVDRISAGLTVDFILVVIIIVLAYVCIAIYKSREKDREEFEVVKVKHEERILAMTCKYNDDIRAVSTEAVNGLRTVQEAVARLDRELDVDGKITEIRAKLDLAR